MMKQIITTITALSVILILSAAGATAQDMKKSFLSIQLGVALPVGDYASTSQYSEKSAYAETGFSGAIKFTQMLNNSFGLGFAIHNDINALNTSELELQFQQQLPGIYVSVNADSWKSTSFLVGGEFLEPLSATSNSVFELSLMIGYMSATFPATNFTFASGPVTGFIDYPSTGAGAFAFLIGGGFYLGVSEKISIPITIDYLTGTPHFDSSVVNTSAGPMTLDGYDQPISNFNLMTGIVIQLN